MKKEIVKMTRPTVIFLVQTVVVKSITKYLFRLALSFYDRDDIYRICLFDYNVVNLFRKFQCLGLRRQRISSW